MLIGGRDIRPFLEPASYVLEALEIHLHEHVIGRERFPVEVEMNDRLKYGERGDFREIQGWSSRRIPPAPDKARALAGEIGISLPGDPEAAIRRERQVR